MTPIEQAAKDFANAWKETTEIRREIYKNYCTEKSRGSEKDGDPGVPACYIDREADPETMCDHCVARLAAKRKLQGAKKKVVSLRGKLLRITNQ